MSRASEAAAWVCATLIAVTAPSAWALPPGWETQPSLPAGLGEPALVDVDLNGSIDLVYAGDGEGNLYRIDVSADEPSSWRAVLLFRAWYGDVPITGQPITQRPFAMAHPQGSGFLVVFATGIGIADNDADDTSVQSIYAVWDRGGPNPATASLDSKRYRLVEREVVNVVFESNGTLDWRRLVVGGPVHYVADAPGSRGTYGWYIDLDMPRAQRTQAGNPNPDNCGAAPPAPQYPGERARRRFIARGDSLIVATVLPRSARLCDGAPSGSVLAIGLIDGSSVRRQVFDIDGNGRIDGDDLVTYRGATYTSGVVVPDAGTELGEPVLVTDRHGLGHLMIDADGGRLTVDVDALGGQRTGRLSWRELSDLAP